MTYATLMVHLDLDHSNDARLRIAGDQPDTVPVLRGRGPGPLFQPSNDL